MQLHINNMSCGGCARSVTKTIQSVDPEAAVEIDLASRNVELRSTKPLAPFAVALAEAGYPVAETA